MKKLGNWQLLVSPPKSAYQHLATFLKLFLLFGLFAVVPSREALGHTIGLIHQTTQELRSTDGGTNDEEGGRLLQMEQRFKRELAGGEQHTYQVRLSADQFLKVVVEQDGIDVAVQVLGPDRKQILEFDSESRLRGQESVLLVAEAAGDYQLMVRPKQKGMLAGRYEIQIEELRAATENDRVLHEARKLYEEALKLQGEGKYDEAIPLVERTLEKREKLLGLDQRDVASAINRLAILYFNKGEYAKAELLHQRALTIRQRVLEPEHPEVAASLNNLALLYQTRGDYAKAEPFFLSAIGILEKVLGPEHLNFSYCLNNLAVLYCSHRGEYEKAEPLFLKVLAVREKALGPEHPEVAACLTNLAIIYLD